VDAVSLEGPGGASARLVLKRWLRPGWEEEDPDTSPAREAAVLAALGHTGVPVPEPIAVDADGQAVGAPALLMTHIDGRRPSLADEARPARIAAMAAALVRIHAVDSFVCDVVGPFRPYYEHERLRAPGATTRPALWRGALALTAGEPPAALDACFLHRDFHPANTIWRASRLTAVVDWASAAVGPAEADLAHWRANLGSRHGIEAADRVLAAYTAAGGTVATDQAWWDMRLLLDFLDEPDALAGDELDGIEAYLQALLGRD
jgi:aminoglycoside phosphotransferase (APT) family kinase protein